jgi:aminopeptidase N
MLRMMLRKNGSDPDATFMALLKEFAETYSGKAASTWDFRRLAEKHSGQKLDWFFDQWVFGTGLPVYALEYKVEGSGNQYTIEGKITQTGVPDGFVMPVPVYADGEYLDTIEPGDLDEPFRLRVSKKPEQVVIDPEMTILTGASQ